MSYTDIIVTTPKSKIKEAAEEAETIKSGDYTHYYRRYKNAPPVSKEEVV